MSVRKVNKPNQGISKSCSKYSQTISACLQKISGDSKLPKPEPVVFSFHSTSVLYIIGTGATDKDIFALIEPTFFGTLLLRVCDLLDPQHQYHLGIY